MIFSPSRLILKDFGRESRFLVDPYVHSFNILLQLCRARVQSDWNKLRKSKQRHLRLRWHKLVVHRCWIDSVLACASRKRSESSVFAYWATVLSIEGSSSLQFVVDSSSRSPSRSPPQATTRLEFNQMVVWFLNYEESTQDVTTALADSFVYLSIVVHVLIPQSMEYVW